MTPRTIQVTASIIVPRTPGFFRLEEQESATIPIEDVSDDELREIGRLWTEELVEHAQQRRAAP